MKLLKKLLTTNYSLLTKKGFTLLELLVVIGIITTLVSVGVVSYSTAQKKSRDARRKSDAKSIQSAFEQYYSINNYQYPITSAGSLSGDLTSTNAVTLLTFPQDPTGGFYQCTSCNASSYRVCMTLESETSGSFCVNNQQ